MSRILVLLSAAAIWTGLGVSSAQADEGRRGDEARVKADFAAAEARCQRMREHEERERCEHEVRADRERAEAEARRDRVEDRDRR